MKTVVWIVLALVVVGGGGWLWFYNAPSQREARIAKDERRVMSEYVTLCEAYLAKRYFSLEEREQLDDVLARAKTLRDRYRYGSEQYIMLHSFTEDFTKDSSLPTVEITPLTIPPGVSTLYARELEENFRRYDLLRETLLIKRSYMKTEPEKTEGEQELLKELHRLANYPATTPDLQKQITQMIYDFYK